MKCMYLLKYKKLVANVQVNGVEMKFEVEGTVFHKTHG